MKTFPINSRLEVVTLFLIHQKQLGLCGTGAPQTTFNDCYVDTANCDTPTAAFSLDAEKAFDKVEYLFYFIYYKNMGLGNI